MTKKNLLLPLLLLAFLAPTASIAQQTAPKEKRNFEETYKQLNLFGDVYERVKSFYVKDVDDAELVENALNGMLTSLDPHSSYLNPAEFKDMQVQTRGEFGGLGIEFLMEDGYVKIITAVDETPAQKAGLQPNDLITHLDGESILTMTSSAAIKKMRGNVGEPITLTIRRGDPPQSFDVKLVRALIKVKSVRSNREGNIGYIRITNFNDQTQIGLEKAIKDLSKEIGEDKIIGYILDLRNNPGGLLDQAISVSDSFLNEGEIVSTKSRNPENDQRFFATKGDLTNNKPLVVLINAGSASASEIVAGALKDHKRALLVGTKTFGKGSVQTIMPLPGNGAMRITTALYYTPSGTSIQALGIEPDIEVLPAKVEQIDTTRLREADLQNALKNGNKPDPNAKETAPATKDPAKTTAPKDKASTMTGPQGEEIIDYQLERAKDLLIGLSIYNKADIKTDQEPGTGNGTTTAKADR